MTFGFWVLMDAGPCRMAARFRKALTMVFTTSSKNMVATLEWKLDRNSNATCTQQVLMCFTPLNSIQNTTEPLKKIRPSLKTILSCKWPLIKKHSSLKTTLSSTLTFISPCKWPLIKKHSSFKTTLSSTLTFISPSKRPLIKDHSFF